MIIHMAAGSVINSDVPEGELAIARPRQENKKLNRNSLLDCYIEL